MIGRAQAGKAGKWNSFAGVYRRSSNEANVSFKKKTVRIVRTNKLVIIKSEANKKVTRRAAQVSPPRESDFWTSLEEVPDTSGDIDLCVVSHVLNTDQQVPQVLTCLSLLGHRDRGR